MFAGIGTGEAEGLIKAAKPSYHGFQRGETLWREGEVVDGLGVLESGTLLCRRYHSDGRALLMRLFEPGDIINVEAAVSRRRTSPTFVTAAMDGGYIRFSCSGLFENPGIPQGTLRTIHANLLACLADEAIRFIKRTDMLSQRTIRGRVTTFLNVLRENQGDEIDIGMNQEELAQYLFVDRSSLSEELNKMRREGLIDFKKKVVRLNFSDTEGKDGG